MNHLRHANKSDVQQRAALLDIVRSCPSLMQAFQTARELDLPDWWIVSGAIYNQVFNHLLDHPDMFGVKDIDLFYFDPDTSYAAEGAVINRAAREFASEPPVEIRNQARVHLWYEAHFSHPYKALTHSCEAIDRFASRTHCIGLSLKSDDQFDLYAPFGLNEMFSFRMVPNPPSNSRKTHEVKGARHKLLWPELDIVPWPS